MIKRLLKLIPGFVRRAILMVVILGLVLGFFVGIFAMEYYNGNDKMSSVIYNRAPGLAFLTRTYKILDILYFWSFFQRRKLPVYELEIDKKDLEKLYENLPEISQSSWGGSELKKENVDGVLRYDDREYKVSARFRGDSQVHWAYPKKSWRVKIDKNEIKKNGLINGMKEFNFIVGEDRSFISEQLNNYRAEKLGLLVPQSEFVDLKINGEYHGAYYLSEQWSGDFLERNGVKPDINLYGESALSGLIGENMFTYLENFRKYTQDDVSEIDNYAEMDKLLHLIRELSDEEFWAQIPNLIDMDNFYAWNAQAMLAGSDHQDYAHNLRIYFDNTLGKFRFIPWEVNHVERGGFYDFYVSPLIDRILKNPEFLEKRNELLWGYVKDNSNLEDDLGYYNETFALVKISYRKDRLKSVSSLYFDRQIVNRRRILVKHYKDIQDKLKEAFASVEVRLGLEDKRVTAQLDFLTRNYSPLELVAVEFNSGQDVNAKLYFDKNKNDDFDGSDVLVSDFRRKDSNTYYASSSVKMIAKRNWEDFDIDLYDQPIELGYNKYSFFVVSNQQDIKLDNFDPKVNNTLTGKRADLIIKYVDEDTFAGFDKINLTIEQFVRDNPLFRLSDSGIVLGPGSFTINKDVVVPKDANLKIEPDTILKMGEGVSLVSYSPVEIDWVVFRAIDVNKPWGVLGLTEGASGSVIKNSTFETGSDDIVNGIYFSGMLSAYWGEVEINNCTFKHAQADDSVNIRNSDSLIRNSIFEENSSDGLDLDFNSSRIENCRFTDNGNDALDISSGEPFIYGNYIKGNGDKGISIGEKSKPVIINNLIKDNKIGIEIKDLSNPKIINNTIINNDIGINLYQKKAIFGGGNGEVYNSIIWDNDKSIELDKYSKILIEYSDVEAGFEGKGNFEAAPQLDFDYKIKNGNLRANAKILNEYIEMAPDDLLMGIY